MKTYSKQELANIIELHKKWLAKESAGERADLSRADLSRANLRDADLRDANLSRANLRDADLREAYLPSYQILPQEGSFIGWKRITGNKIIKLLIPAEAKRVNTPTERKCRAEYVQVLDIQDAKKDVFGQNRRTLPNNQEWIAGITIYPDSFNDDIREVCTNGIHFFITREEAEDYTF